MNEHTETCSSVRRKRRILIGGALLLFALVITAERVHTYHEELERDITCYAVIGHELLSGRPLYSDLWDNKPPALHVTFAAFELLAGYGPSSIFLLNVAFAVATMLGVYAAGRAAGGTAGGLWAAAFWTVICGDLFLQANQPNTEVMINACRIWAFALMVKAADKPRRPAYWIGIGALFALASLYKQFTVVTAAALVFTHVIFSRPKRPALLQGAEIAGVGVAAWALVFGYFMVAGRFDDFFGAVFRYNIGYAGDQGMNVSRGLSPSLLVPPYLRFAWPLALLTLAALILVARKSPRAFAMLAALILATVVEVALPGKFFPHYYQYWLPVLCVGGGWGVTALAGRLPPRFGRFAHAGGIAALALLLAHEAPFYRLSATEWSRRKNGESFIESAKLAREIDEMLAPGEMFFVWGSAPELYYYTRRRPPYAALFTDPLRYGPMVREMSLRAIAGFEKAPPELFVVLLEDDTILDKLPYHPVSRGFIRRFVPLPERPFRHGFAVFYRVDGALAARLKAESAGPSLAAPAN